MIKTVVLAYCAKCGNQLSQDALFCHKCGAPVGVAAAPGPRAQRPRTTPMSALTITLIVIIAVAAVAVIAIMAASGTSIIPGVVIGSGHSVTHQENFTGFTAVTVSSGFRFTITHSSTYGVNVTTDDNIFSYVQVTKTGNMLSVGLKSGYTYLSAPPKVEIKMPDVAQLDLSGGTSGTLGGFALSHDFAATASGGSVVTITGAAPNLTLEASGGSRLNLPSFNATNAHVELSGGSQATINVNGRLDANLSGGSQLFYSGNPTLGNIDVTGGSTISKR